jgi:hypothetical protein
VRPHPPQKRFVIAGAERDACIASGAERLVEAWPAGMPSAAATKARRPVPGKSAGPSGRRSGGKSGDPFGGLFGGMAEYFPMVGDVRAGTQMINPVAAKLTD